MKLRSELWTITAITLVKDAGQEWTLEGPSQSRLLQKPEGCQVDT